MALLKYNGDTVKDWAGDSQWRAWLADVARANSLFSEGLWALTIYRMQHAMHRSKRRWTWLPLSLPLHVVKKAFTMVTHINLDRHARIGPGLLIVHVGPIQVFPWATIGADCALHHVTTVGAGSKPGGPVIGDHVMLGCHSCVLGPVTVGDGAQIGAGAVVVTDVPPWSTAVGVPAKVINRKEA